MADQTPPAGKQLPPWAQPLISAAIAALVAWLASKGYAPPVTPPPPQITVLSFGPPTPTAQPVAAATK